MAENVARLRLRSGGFGGRNRNRIDERYARRIIRRGRRRSRRRNGMRRSRRGLGFAHDGQRLGWKMNSPEALRGLREFEFYIVDVLARAIDLKNLAGNFCVSPEVRKGEGLAGANAGKKFHDRAAGKNNHRRGIFLEWLGVLGGPHDRSELRAIDANGHFQANGFGFDVVAAGAGLRSRCGKWNFGRLRRHFSPTLDRDLGWDEPGRTAPRVRIHLLQVKKIVRRGTFRGNSTGLNS